MILLSVWVLTLVQCQTPAPPFAAPYCPDPFRTKTGQCSLEMSSSCDCDPNNVRCSHDGECPGNLKCCSWGCKCRTMCAPPGVSKWPTDPPLHSRCELPQVSGHCNSLPIRRFYFNITTRRCEPFIPGSCCGNANKFPTKTSCDWACL